jgi:hypothetical protein
MRWLQKILPAVLLTLWLLSAPAPVRAVEQASGEAAAAAVARDPQMAEELRRIHREIAALRADLAQPGLQEVFSGLGYILGLFGVAAFVAARRKGP